MNFSFLIEKWDGYFFVLLSIVVQAVFIFLGNMGRGLMKGGLKLATKTWFWVIVIIYYIFQNLVGFSLLFSGRWIPFFLLVGVQIVSIIMLSNAKKTNKAADSINEHRMMKHSVVNDFLSLIGTENPARVVVMEDGIVCDRSLFPFVFDKSYVNYKPSQYGNETSALAESLSIPRYAQVEPGLRKEYRFSGYGYQNMDDNTKRTFASILAKNLGNYECSEHAHTHEEIHIRVDSGGPATAYQNPGTNSYSIYGGGGSSSEETKVTKTDGYSYFLIRKDLLPQKTPVQVKEKEDKPKLKKW